MTSVPYLSVIGWVRNDGYMEGYAARIRRAIQFLVGQLNRYRIPSEIVLVDWNPPSDRPLMADVVGNLDDGGYVTLRFIMVDERYHRGAIGAEHKGMHVMNAANTGLRRARGRFLVPKAIDTFFTETILERIARQDLRDDEVYRCDRHDVAFGSDEWLGWSDEELLKQMAERVMHRHERLVQSPEWGMRDLHTNACGDFTLMAAHHWFEIRGYQYDPTVLCLDADSIALHAVAAHGVREVCWPDDCRVYKVVHDNVFGHRISEEWKDWQRHLDLFVTKRFSPNMRIKMRMLFDYPRRRVRGISGIIGPSIERNFVMKARRYAKSDTSLVTNSEDWGLARERLAERTAIRAGWDHAAD